METESYVYPHTLLEYLSTTTYMSKKRRFEEIFDENENIPFTPNKIRKYDFESTNLWNKWVYCFKCRKKCVHKETVIKIHDENYQCLQCYKINQDVNKEKNDIFDSICVAINVYNDLLMDENIIHLIANYSTGCIIKCCNDNKCQQIICY
eukprot:46946_1